jgi:glycosyltransferase involved in cell wall biosynthesis
MNSTIQPLQNQPLKNQSTSAQQERNSELLVSVAVVLPRQAQQLEERVEKALGVLSKAYEFHELLLVDNGSPLVVPALVLELQQRLPNIRLLRLSRCYSREVALAAALDHCIGDYVVTMDLLADPMELIPILVTRAAGGFDAVVGECQDRPARFLERTISVPVYRLTSRILGFSLHPDESYFRVFSRRLVNSIVRIRSRNRYLSCLNGIVGFQQCSVVYHQDAAPARDSGRVLKQLLAITDILVSNSAAPLRLAALLGFVASLANVAYLGYILVVSLVKRHVAEGWITTSLTQTTMFLMVFLILSILSEYVARILDETKEQPLYFVEFETNSTVASPGGNRLNIA